MLTFHGAATNFHQGLAEGVKNVCMRGRKAFTPRTPPSPLHTPYSFLPPSPKLPQGEISLGLCECRETAAICLTRAFSCILSDSLSQFVQRPAPSSSAVCSGRAYGSELFLPVAYVPYERASKRRVHRAQVSQAADASRIQGRLLLRK